MKNKTLLSLFAIIFFSLLLVGQNIAQDKASQLKNIGKFISVSENGNLKDVQGTSIAIITGTDVGQKIGGLTNPYTGNPVDYWAGTFNGTVDSNAVNFYCIDINNGLVYNQNYTDEGPTSTEITYILNNYFPYKSFPYSGSLSTNKKEASAIQATLWHYADGLDVSTIGDSEIEDRVNEIIADVAANAGSTIYPDYFSITPTPQNIFEGEIGTFQINALDTDGNPYAGLVVNLSTTSGNLSTNQVTTDANGNATFTIAQDGANFATITALAQATIPQGTKYFHVDKPDEKQKLVLATPTIATSSAIANITWQPNEVTLGDYVWHDSNVNGIQDNGEIGIADVIVELYDDNDTLLSTDTTDISGYYKFTQLQNETYVVKIADANFNAGGVFEGSANEKWYLTYANEGNDDTVDSNGDENNSSEVTISNNDDDFTIDFGFFKTCITFIKTGPATVNAGDLINYTFKVINCGDLPLRGGASVYDPMLNPNGDHKIRNAQVEPGETWEFTASYTTNKDDCGILENEAWAIGHPKMPDGSYKENIRYDDSHSVEVICEEKASLGDRVWYDDNENGIQDLGEDGVKDVTVNLFDCNDLFVATTTTDNDGYYLFDELEPGNYYVEFVLPNGYLFTTQNAGNDSAVDSDADETTGKTVCTDLIAGEVDLTWDAGIYIQSVNDFDLSIVKTASNVNPDDEAIFTYTITVTNNSSTDGTNITVSDILPAGLIYQSSNPAGYDTTTGIWNVGDIAAGDSESLEITVKVDYLSLGEAPIFDLGIAAEFNLFVLKDVVQPSSDTEGKVAVGRNATFGNYSVGDKLPLSGGTVDVLIVGRKLTYTSGQVYGGNIVYGKYLDVQQTNLASDGSIRKEDPVPVDFAQAKIDLEALSSQLSTKAATGTTTFEWGGLTLTGTEPILNVFEVDGNDLSVANNMEINVPNGSVVLVNISRKDVSWTGGLVVNGTGIGNVLYNFYKTRTLKIQGIDIQGSILAPRAKVNFVAGVINGQMICKFFEGQGQMNNSLFHGSINGNPEITNCAEIQSYDQIDIDLSNNISCAPIVVNVDVNPNNGDDPDNGSQWVETNGTGLNEMIWTMYQGSNSQLYVGTVGGNIYLNDNDDFKLLNEDMNVSYIWSLYELDGILYAGTDLGLYKFNGTTWKKVDLDGDVRSITSLNNVLYAAVWGGGVFASSDNGDTWSAINEGLLMSGYAVQTLTVTDSNLFVGTFALGVLKYDFASSTWVQLPVGFPFIWSLATDVDNNIYAATSGDGMYVSTDEGESWVQVNTGLQNVHIYSVSVYGNDVYISTWAGGVYKYITGSLGKADSRNPSVATSPTTGSWSSLGMGGIEVSSIMIDEATQTLYAGTSTGAIYKKADGVTGINTESETPTKFSLAQNYPNPFNPSTIIEFSIPEAGLYVVKVFNVLGQEVAIIANQDFTIGKYSFNFDASNLTSGIYFYKLVGDKVNMTKKMLLLK
ncbi:MAG: choice-of-anchor A family protein [Melioribacteraceae bacterium]|nr:choice-of-anchor A family protein [Melioribacteraceae bacterium]